MQTKRKRDPMLSMRCYEHGWDPAEDINVDEDGQITSASLTYEASGTSIEVLIELDTPPAEAAELSAQDGGLGRGVDGAGEP